MPAGADLLPILGGPPVAKGPGRRKPPRSAVPAGANLCDHCTAKCCGYTSLPLPRVPRTWADFDEVRWFLSRPGVSVYVDGRHWYILFESTCHHLLPDYRCGIYADRPAICRGYETDGCEYEDDFTFAKVFEHDRQVYEYAEVMLGPREV